jgi:plasmid maintenance system antidote protein VapI
MARSPQKTITEAGTAMYGLRFQAPLAAALGIPPSRVSMMLSSDRPISDAIMRKLGSVLAAETKSLRDRTTLITVLARQIDQDFPQ